MVDDEQWHALVGLIGGALDDDRFATVAGRVAHHDEIDALISAWSSTLTPADAATRLQAAGVAAYDVLDSAGVLHDPQVRDRAWVQLVPSSRFPDGDVFSGHPIRLAELPGSWWRAGPSLGEDTVEVLRTRLGLSDDDVAALVASGAAFTAASPELTAKRPYIDYAEIIGAHRSSS